MRKAVANGTRVFNQVIMVMLMHHVKRSLLVPCMLGPQCLVLWSCLGDVLRGALCHISWLLHVFSCGKQLYNLCMSVYVCVCLCVSVCVCVSVTAFSPCSYHPIFMKLTPDLHIRKSLWNVIFQVKRSKVKVTGVKWVHFDIFLCPLHNSITIYWITTICGINTDH